MSKERLEEVIELMCESYHDYLVADNTKRSEVRHKSYLDCKEIIKSEFEKQAERVQELEDVNSQLGYLIGKVYGQSNFEIKDLIERNKRYRKALEYIADNKIEHGWHLKAVNCVVRARRALEGEE